MHQKKEQRSGRGRQEHKERDLHTAAEALEADVLAVCQENNAHEQNQLESADEVQVLAHACSEHLGGLKKLNVMKTLVDEMEAQGPCCELETEAFGHSADA